MKLARPRASVDARTVSVQRLLIPGIALGCLLLAASSSRAQSLSPQGQNTASQGAARKPGSQKPKKAQEKKRETEADRVVEDSELQARLAAERERLLEEHFLVCDLDENGWISFREATTILGISRKEFRRYDTDGDGDIDSEEFRERARTILGLLGALPSPKSEPPADSSQPAAKKRSKRPPAIEVETLLERFDGDASGSLDPQELRKLFELTEADLSSALISERMDPNGSGALEANELRPLATLMTELRLELPLAATLADDPEGTNFEDLYRPARAPERPSSLTSGPPRLEGPLSHFRRLDLWNDGYIDENDLRQLIAPARVEVRVAAILSALDTDGDNRLSEDEFRTALTGR